ncbi:hypothetical protein HJG60_010274 [Phyllostomus discolor]|uniref:Reverse transcriptase domain-containing protein n=1 Tax=Phyllostomus discolor TaxID=89673 RepID=A0A834EJT4_9CHIR|nr:hypothetical protein HJG60_010274 [Phyllostomus discolor]
MFPLRSRTRQGHTLSPLLFSIVLKVLTTVIRQEEEIKGIQPRKEEIKLSLFVGDIIVCIENLIGSTKKLPELINDFVKVVGYKVNIQKLMEFFCINNELSESETSMEIFTIATRKIKYLGINVTKEEKRTHNQETIEH